MGRKEKIADKVRDHLEPDETVEQVALVKSPLSNYALIATAQNVYAFKLGGLGYSRIKEATMKIPIAEAVVNVTGNGIAVGQRGTDVKQGWGQMPFQKVDAFVDYVALRGQGG